MADFILHNIKCLCFEYKTKAEKEDVYFSVCSEINDNNELVKHFAQCPNCGNIHLVEDFNKSRLQGKDETNALPKIEELELEIPERVARLLTVNNVPIHIWLAAKYIFQHKIFPNCLVLGQEEQKENQTQIPKILTKLLIIDDEAKFQIINDLSEPLLIVSP